MLTALHEFEDVICQVGIQNLKDIFVRKAHWMKTVGQALEAAAVFKADRAEIHAVIVGTNGTAIDTADVEDVFNMP